MWFNELPNDIEEKINSVTREISKYHGYKKVHLQESTKRERRNLLFISVLGILAATSNINISENQIVIFSNVTISFTEYKFYLLLFTVNLYLGLGYFSSLWHENIFEGLRSAYLKSKLVKYINIYIRNKIDASYFDELAVVGGNLRNDQAKRGEFLNGMGLKFGIFINALQTKKQNPIDLFEDINNYLNALRQYSCSCVVYQTELADKEAKLLEIQNSNDHKLTESNVLITISELKRKHMDKKNDYKNSTEVIKILTKIYGSETVSILMRDIVLNYLVPFSLGMASLILLIAKLTLL